ncbi:hypothetical protein G7Y79_00039g075890 [Physcia stellaris]|nr:hypothetical protein G7Y79_00039g075890 [Physcia stellaris]
MAAEAKSQTTLKDFSSIFSLEGKVAVVTGGSRGLGLHAASGFLQAGCSRVYITSRKKAACDSACEALNALPNKRPGAKAISVPADSAKIADVEALVKEVSNTTDHVDILFANAGATWGEKFDTHPDSAFAKVMDLNVKSVFNTIRLFAPLLQKKATMDNPSRVIVTASTAGMGVGTLGEQATFGYSASKAAVIHLTRNLAVELGPRHILCNSIAPGFFPSKMASGLMDIQGGEAVIAKANPNGRLGKAEDIAGTVVYLASRASSHCNGTTITLDGGAFAIRSRSIALLVSQRFDTSRAWWRIRSPPLALLNLAPQTSTRVPKKPSNHPPPSNTPAAKVYRPKALPPVSSSTLLRLPPPQSSFPFLLSPSPFPLPKFLVLLPTSNPPVLLTNPPPPSSFPSPPPPFSVPPSSSPLAQTSQSSAPILIRSPSPRSFSPILLPSPPSPIVLPHPLSSIPSP